MILQLGKLTLPIKVGQRNQHNLPWIWLSIIAAHHTQYFKFVQALDLDQMLTSYYAQLFHYKNFRNRPFKIEWSEISWNWHLKKINISRMKHILLICKKHLKAYLIMCKCNNFTTCKVFLDIYNVLPEFPFAMILSSQGLF